MTFSNHKKKSEDNEEELTPSPYRTSPTWAMESFFIDIYSLLVHRIKGLGLSLSDFWQWDTWTTSKMYCMELELIDEEDKALNDDEDSKQDSEEMKDLYEEMWGEDV
jgi:hypothetical protein